MILTAELRYSVACRSIVDPQGKVVLAGHGGRISSAPSGPCPVCRRPMILTGSMSVQQLRG